MEGHCRLVTLPVNLLKDVNATAEVGPRTDTMDYCEHAQIRYFPLKCREKSCIK